MQSVLNKARRLLADKGRIYVRCHPFTSRHATHLYQQCNKAFLHLLTTEEERSELGLKSMTHHQEAIRYEDEFSSAGLDTLWTRREILDHVEDFYFETFGKRLPAGSRELMRIQFVDFTLTKKRMVF
jgi:hypothetical protein